jgi:ubiquinone biosynthesis monooxygenase Coq7
MSKTDKTQTEPRRPLPGEPGLSAAIDSMIRVDQAGEYGAARIYDGQLAVLGEGHRMTPTIRRMREEEQSHLDVFNNLVALRGTRPTALQPFWNAAGYALGAATALMGEKAAMACTVAVEEVIEEHYEEQRRQLKSWQVEPELEATIAEFQADEIEHKDTAIDAGAEEATGYRVLAGAIRAGCRTAIWLSKRI